MAETLYKVWSWGAPTQEGRNEQFDVGICAKAKRNPANRFEIANEMLCERLGRAINLPIPAGVVLEREGKEYFASLDCSGAAESLPDWATDDDIRGILDDKWLTCGIIVFDCWILNEDRGRANIAYDEDTGGTHIFDHGSALFDWDGDSADLARIASMVSIGGHCLAEQVTSLDDFDEWHARIKSIPEFYIRETVMTAVQFGIPADAAPLCIDFLLERRTRLKELIQKQVTTVFPKLERTLFDPFAQSSAADNERNGADWCI